MNHLLLATDAWRPQVNGVVRALEETVAQLRNDGWRVTVVEPSLGPTIPLPGYPMVRLSLTPGRLVRSALSEGSVTHIHVATEGPIGLSTRRECLRRGWALTTSLHTKFPEYARVYIGVAERYGYAYLRWFHRPASCVLMATDLLIEEMAGWGIHNGACWPLGINLDVFKPTPGYVLPGSPPHLMYFGRVAREKNIEAFLDLPLFGTKHVFGDGPHERALRRQYPEVHFIAPADNQHVARIITAADVVVMPSLSETYGLVVGEANACGVPVAALSRSGPGEQIINGVNGCVDEDLIHAIRVALHCSRLRCREQVLSRSWRETTAVFSSLLVMKDVLTS